MRNFVVSVDLSGEVDVGPRATRDSARPCCPHWRVAHPANALEDSGVHTRVSKVGPTSPRKAISDSGRVTELMVPHSGQSSVRQAKLGVSDWVQVPIE